MRALPLRGMPASGKWGLNSALIVLAVMQLRELMNRTGPPGPGTSPEAAVSSYLTLYAPLGAKANFGTWDSLVHSLASASELRCAQRALSAISMQRYDLWCALAVCPLLGPK